MNQTSKKKKSNRKVYLLTLLFVTTGLLLFFLLKPDGKNASPATTAAMDIPFTKEGELLFISSESTDTLATIDIEVADDNQKRARGLMYRLSLPDNGGMLFMHEREEMQSFWMKNTYIPLDIIFINSAKEIVTIHPNTRPMKEWSYASTEPSRYVVEVNAGFCSRYHIKRGDKITFLLHS